MVEVNCETDFVARNPDFQTLVKDIAMHIAASDPRFIRKEDVTEEVLAKEREIYLEQSRATGKPENVLEKIVEGRMSKYYSEACLLEQPFVKDPSVTVRDYIASLIQKIGENIQVRRFIRYKLGGE
jgi:elongation factor Ts